MRVRRGLKDSRHRSIPVTLEPMSDTDLSFAAVTNAHPAWLSAAQIDAFNQFGFIRPLDVFSEGACAANRAYFDSLLRQVPTTGAYSINCYQARCAGIWDLCVTPRILDYVQDLIGPNIICWASHFFCKMPFDSKTVPWHQDAAYWHLSPARTVTAWLAIDDADEGNSAMRFIAGTHQRGRLAIAKSQGEAVLELETVGAEALGTPVSDCLKAGQISLHADMLVHGSLPNTSARRRCGLTIRYCPPEVGFTDEKWARSVEPIICRGTDPYGRWRHRVKPSGDNPALSNGPHNIGGN